MRAVYLSSGRGLPSDRPALCLTNSAVAVAPLQHVLLLLKLLLSYAIPDTPAWLQTEIAKIEFNRRELHKRSLSFSRQTSLSSSVDSSPQHQRWVPARRGGRGWWGWRGWRGVARGSEGCLHVWWLGGKKRGRVSSWVVAGWREVERVSSRVVAGFRGCRGWWGLVAVVNMAGTGRAVAYRGLSWGQMIGIG